VQIPLTRGAVRFGLRSVIKFGRRYRATMAGTKEYKNSTPAASDDNLPVREQRRCMRSPGREHAPCQGEGSRAGVKQLSDEIATASNQHLSAW